MAKRDQANTENTETVATEGAPAASRGKKVMLKGSDGTEIARADFIKARFAAGVTRSAIVKELKEQFGHEVPYQIVFAATKQPKATAEAAPEAAAAE